MELILDANNQGSGKEPFTRANLLVPGLTIGANSDGIFEILIKRIYAAWKKMPDEKKKPVPGNRVSILPFAPLIF